MCFLDLTNTYLEGQASANPKAKRARSKEKRSDCKLLTLALIIDEQGFPKYSHLYAGNQSEGKTLPEMIQSLIGIRPDLAQHRTIIMDAGIATEENIQYLKDNQFHYIVVNRGKADFTPDDTEQMQVVHHDDNRQFQLEVARREEEGEAFLLCRSTGREQKDRSIRTRQEDLFIERLEYYKSGLGKKGRTKDYVKLIEMIGRLREKYPRASKLYGVTVIPDKDVTEKKNNVKARDIIWEKRNADYLKFDGCYVLRTDLVGMTDQEIWKTYMMLTRVENAFRCLKSSLGLRPVFHQIEWRSDAHMFISVLAYHLLHVIEQKLRSHGDHRSWDTILDILSTHQRLTIQYDVQEQDQEKTIRYHLNLCSNPEPEQKMIYHNLSYDELFRHETNPDLEGFEKAFVTSTGAINVDTGIFTGRSPKDKYIVNEETSRENIWWAGPGRKSDNKPISADIWNDLYDTSAKELSGKNLYVQDGFSGCNTDTRIRIRVITEVAWMAHFVKNMFIRPTEEELKDFEPDFVLFLREKKTKKELYAILANHTGKDVEIIEKDGDRDYWMTSYEAKEYGMIDAVMERTKK